MNRVTLEEAQDIILSAMYEYIYDNASDDYIDINSIRALCRAPFSPAFVRRAISLMQVAGLIENMNDDFEMRTTYTVSAAGWARAENLPTHDELLSISEILPLAYSVVDVPASDRLVDIDHNRPGYIEIASSFTDLQSNMLESNDIGQLSASEVTVALKEVEDLATDFSRPRVRIPAFLERAKSTLGWIGVKGAETAIGAAATALIALIIAFFGGAN